MLLKLSFGISVLVAHLALVHCAGAEVQEEIVEEDLIAEDPLGSAGNESTRDSRLFSLFKLYTNIPVPANTKCEHEGLAGHCLKRTQCKSVNGGEITSTTCSSGLGICCLINLKWDSVTTPGKIKVKHSPSHIVSSGKANIAVYEIAKQKDVCQIKLDFKSFSLEQPLRMTGAEDGTCALDVFSVSGAQNLDRFALCGENTGQHMYLHYGESELIKIYMDITRETSIYDIQVTMIKCSSLERVPDDCTQYYTHSRGIVRSFNYPHQQLNDQRYSVCVKSDSSSIQWSECVNLTSDPFFISGIDNASSATDCRGDHLTIPGYVEYPSSPVYCGGVFPTVKVSSLKPFMMLVSFDGGEPELSAPLPNGCPAGFICGMTTAPNTECPPGTIPYVCSPPCQCQIQVVKNENSRVLELDLNNTGFCLQYSKS